MEKRGERQTERTAGVTIGENWEMMGLVWSVPVSLVPSRYAHFTHHLPLTSRRTGYARALRAVSPTGVEWVGSGTRPISSHSSRFLVSSLVPHSVPRNRLSFVEISPSQVKWRTEQTKDDPRQ